MIKVKLVNLFRRAGTGFPMRSPHREHICDMQINPSTALHEAEVPLEVFLKHSKVIAQQAQQVGCGVFVADISLDIPAAVQEFWAGYNLAMDGRPITDGASASAAAGHIVGCAQGHEIKEPSLPMSEPTVILPDSNRGYVVNALKMAEVQDAKDLVDGLSDETVSAIVDNIADAGTENTALAHLPTDEQIREMGYKDMRTLAQPFNAYKLGMKTEELRAALLALRTPVA